MAAEGMCAAFRDSRVSPLAKGKALSTVLQILRHFQDVSSEIHQPHFISFQAEVLLLTQTCDFNTLDASLNHAIRLWSRNALIDKSLLDLFRALGNTGRLSSSQISQISAILHPRFEASLDDLASAKPIVNAFQSLCPNHPLQLAWMETARQTLVSDASSDSALISAACLLYDLSALPTFQYSSSLELCSGLLKHLRDSSVDVVENCGKALASILASASQDDVTATVAKLSPVSIAGLDLE